MATYRLLASHVMYHVCPVFPAFESELLLPYSPVEIEPSMVGVAHCAIAGTTAAISTARTKASFSTRERSMINPRKFSDRDGPAASNSVVISKVCKLQMFGLVQDLVLAGKN